MTYILFDIGGSKMRVVASKNLKKFEGEPIIEPTKQDYDEGLAQLARLIEEASGGGAITAIAGGIAGRFDEKGESLAGAPHLKDWIGKPFVSDLQGEFSVDVIATNDTGAAGLGEAHFGAGVDSQNMAYITVSTGVGGKQIVDGKLDLHQRAEPGKQIIDFDETSCSDCEGVTLEHLIGGAATEKRRGKKPFHIKKEAFWEDYAEKLAAGLHNIVRLWSPDTIVLGGSMIIGDPAIPLPQVRSHLRKTLSKTVEVPALREAKLGDLGGLYGAMKLVEQELEQKKK
ncbi:MAG: ROK family protein [Candidatus Paceibacterota bacterium]